MRYALTILLWSSLMRPAAAQLDAVFASWAERYDELSSVEYVLEGAVITTPDFIVGLGAPTQDLTDDPLPVHIHAKLDFKSGRGWLRRDEYYWHVPTKAFQRRITETTINGKKTRVVKVSPKSQMRTTHVYDDPKYVREILRIDVLPLWLNSGTVVLDDRQDALFSFPQYIREVERWMVIPDDVERSGGKMSVGISPAFRGSPTPYTMVVDARNRHVVTNLERQHPQGRSTFEIRLSYSTIGGSYIASQWETAVYAGGRKLRIYENIDVKVFSKGCKFSDELFEIEQANND